MPDLWSLRGRWSLNRRVVDRMAGLGGRFTGETAFTPWRDGLLCEETGWFHPGRGRPLFARRVTRWRALGDRIEVLFEDGRPFHQFDAASARPMASHDCAPDFYRVRYDFRRWPVWRAAWRVTGPRKDYAMVGVYVPRDPDHREGRDACQVAK